MSGYEIVEESYDKLKKGLITDREFYFVLWGKAVHLSADERKKAESLIDKLKTTVPLTDAHNTASLGFLTVYSANFTKGIDCFNEALLKYQKANEPDGILTCNTLLSVCYRSIGQLDKAQGFLQRALKFAEEGDVRKPHYFFKAIAYYQAGELNTEYKNYTEAVDYYNKGLKFTDENPEISARLLSGLGILYMNMGDWERSLKSLTAALDAVDQQKNHLLTSKIYHDVATYYLKREEFDKALENQHKSLKIRSEHKLINPLTTSYVSIAEIYFKMGDFKEAIRYGELAVEQASKLNTIIKLFEAHEILSKAYESTGDIVKAFHHYKSFQKYKAEVHNQETIKKIEQLNAQHKMESVEIEKEIFRLRNVELKAAFEKIEEKQKEILDSIRYAERIQKALMTTEVYIEKALNRLHK
jgi:tetratricopeptide (TPR) repeat protein